MRVTTKGQVTIPRDVRRQLGIRRGSEVRFVVREDEAVITLVDPDEDHRDREVTNFMAHLRSHRGSMDLGGLTPDEFMSLLRD